MSQSKKFHIERSKVSSDILLNSASTAILRGKIREILDSVKTRKWQESFPQFSEHSEEVASFASSRLKRYEVSQRDNLRDTFLFQAFTGLRLYSVHHFLIQSAERDINNPKWISLQNFVFHLSDQIELTKRPVSILGDDYFATGSPMYREYGIQIEKPFYIVVADRFDYPLFWTLSAHELAHCRLSETEHLRKLYKIANEMNLFRRLRMDYCQKRIEQAMCDIIATRLLGPAFVYAYFLRLYPDFLENNAEEEPSHQFRIECMTETLECAELHQIANWIREKRDEKFRKSWEDEEISSLKEVLLKLSDGFPLSIDKRRYEHYSSIVSVPKPDYYLLKDPISLSMACWFKVAETGIGKTLNSFEKLSSVFITELKRASSSANSSA